MSHFTVLVVGDDVAKQLQPFHEFECTGTNDEYVVDVDITDQIRKEMENEDETLSGALDYHGLANRVVASESDVDRNGAHKFGFAIVADGELVKAVDRTNPNRKWDRWVVGGRWTGFFTTKNGTGTLGKAPMAFSDEERTYFAERRSGSKSDSCLWGDVDIAAMEGASRNAAIAAFDKWEPCFIEHGKPETWDAVRERIGNTDEARTAYHSQPALRAHREVDKWGSPMEMGFDREAYVERQAKSAIVPFAILKDGVWHERGEMGWFACVSGEKSNWIDTARELLASIHPNAIVTIVDCHI